MIAAPLAVALTSALLAPAAPAGAGPGTPPVSLSASPSRISLAGRDRTSIRLSNHGSRPVTVSATPGTFTLDARGRPKLVRRGGVRRDASRWLSLRPRKLVVRPGATASLTVASRTPARAEPGDHAAVVLLTTSAPGGGRVLVRMRVGIRVTVRARGRVVRRLVVRSVGVRKAGRRRIFDVSIANRGNVTERLRAGRVTLLVRGRVVARLRTPPRELLPLTGGTVRAAYRGPVRGPAVLRVELAGTARAFRVRL